MRANPVLFETNARLFLRRLSQRYRPSVHPEALEGPEVLEALSLDDVPQEQWELLAALGFDAVWLMGVWHRSSSARQEALRHPVLRHEYDGSLPGWTEQDVEGSPYAVHGYTVDPALGAPGSLRVVRERLHRLGLALLVDFVPNHLALDHPWTAGHPERFVRALPERVAEHPDRWFAGANGTRFAHGRDPYFGPWTDTVQVDFFSEDLRAALTRELLAIAEVADGVRCDMAMLGLNEVFQWLWGDYSPHPRSAEEFWARAVSEVKARNPGFVFLAEAYWGHEPRLQELGFDYTYDKALYDRLRDGDAAGVRAHLAGQRAHGRWARFVENHDEGRAASVFGRERGWAAAAVAATLPGLRLLYDGQMEGRRVKTPVQLVRQPDEPADPDTLAFHERLLRACSADVFHGGDWGLVDVQPTADQAGAHQAMLAWRWQDGRDARLVVINYGPSPAQGVVAAPVSAPSWRDELSPGGPQGNETAVVEAMNGELRLALAPWQACALAPVGP